MRRLTNDFQQLDCDIAVISFEPLADLQRFAAAERLPFLVLSDPELKGYRAFGLHAGQTRQVFGPRTVWAYVRGLFLGRLPRLPHADIHQLGGDVIVDAKGTVALLYRSKDPADRPTVTALLKVLQRTVNTDANDG